MNNNQVVCNVCKSQDIEVVKQNKRIDGSDIMRCKACELRFVHPLPDFSVLAETYDGLYASREQHNKIDFHKQSITRKAFSGYIGELKRLGKEGTLSVADVGGGLGYYSEAAQHHGLDVTSIEMDPQSSKFASEVLGVKQTFCGATEQFIEQSNKRFDVVFMRHVIEHVPDPSGLMENIAKLLNDNGILVIETPNNLSIEIMLRPTRLLFFLKYYKKHYKNITLFDIYTQKLYALRPPNHIYAFRATNLQRLCQKHGLTPRKSFSYMIGSSTYWPNEGKADIRPMFGALVRLQPTRFILNFVDVLLFPLRLVAHLFNRSSSICIYAEKIK